MRETLQPGGSERTDRFLARLEAFRAELASRSIPAGDVEVPTRLSRAAWFAIREGAIVLTAGPVALWGRINHCVPLGLARWASRRWSKTQYRRDPNLQPRLASEFSWLREEAVRLEHEALRARGQTFMTSGPSGGTDG